MLTSLSLVAILAGCCSGAVDDGMFTSSQDLLGLVTTLAELATLLEQDKWLQQQTVVKDYQLLRNKALEDVDRFVGNPINSYLLIRKLKTDIEELTNIMEEHERNSYSELLQKLEHLKWPSDEDLKGAGVALVRLQVLWLEFGAAILYFGIE